MWESPSLINTIQHIFYVQRCAKLINLNFHHRPLDIYYQLARDRRELTARMRG